MRSTTEWPRGRALDEARRPRRKLRSPSPGRPVRMVAVSDFSGLMSSAWALAKAEASAATVSLDRGIGGLGLQHVKAHRPRFRALGFHAVPDGLLGILWHQGFELALCPFVVEKGPPGCCGRAQRIPPRNWMSSSAAEKYRGTVTPLRVKAALSVGAELPP